MEPNLTEIFGSYLGWKLNEDTWVISFMNGTQFMYLLEGEEQALLIDTGWGAGNLRAFVERLTDRPVITALTHGHLDHSGGCGEWERVRMLPGAKEDMVTCRDLPFDVSGLPHADFETVLVQEGDELELGGRRVELIEISAHSNGSLAFLDHKNGLLFVGDEFESSQVLMYDVANIPNHPFRLDERLRAHHANLSKLKERQGEWNTILPGHNGTPIANSYLEDYLELVEQIYAGNASIEDKLNHPFAEAGDPEHRLCRVRWKKASFFVVKEDLLKLYGSHAL